MRILVVIFTLIIASVCQSSNFTCEINTTNKRFDTINFPEGRKITVVRHTSLQSPQNGRGAVNQNIMPIENARVNWREQKRRHAFLQTLRKSKAVSKEDEFYPMKVFGDELITNAVSYADLIAEYKEDLEYIKKQKGFIATDLKSTNPDQLLQIRSQLEFLGDEGFREIGYLQSIIAINKRKDKYLDKVKNESEIKYYEDLIKEYKQAHDYHWASLAKDLFALKVGPVGMGVDEGSLASRKVVFLGEIALPAQSLPSDEELQKIREEAVRKVVNQKGDGIIVEWDYNWESIKILQQICRRSKSVSSKSRRIDGFSR